MLGRHGNLQVIVDINNNEVIEEKYDASGLHYYKNEVVHRSVSGTLVHNPEQTVH